MTIFTLVICFAIATIAILLFAHFRHLYWSLFVLDNFQNSNERTLEHNVNDIGNYYC